MKTPFSSKKTTLSESTPVSSNAWKKKYYKLLQELERQEHDWSEIEAVLRRSLYRMTALGLGQTTEQDNQLQHLRKLVREQAPGTQLGQLVEQIIESSEIPEQTATPSHEIGPDEITKVVDSCLDPNSSKRLIGLLLELASLIIKDPTRSQQWQDWQQQLQSAVTKLQPLATAIIQDLSHQPLTESDLYRLTADTLRSLVGMLPLPDSLQMDVKTIQQQLSSGLDPTSLSKIVQNIADLTLAAQRDLQQQRLELERFLLQLTQRLQEMDQAMSDSSEHSRTGMENAQTMNQAVQSEMAGISTQIETVEELGELKQSVQQHLMRIETNLSNHVENEMERDKKYRRHVEQLVSRLGEMEEETRHLRLRVTEERARALTDKLTGVSNRLAFEERLDQELTRWKRYKSPLSLVFWDIDHFKRINDTYGHKAGDKILQALGALLKKRLRESDFTARFGGEEFISLLPEKLAAAARVADEIRSDIAGFKFNYQGKRVPVSISCGVTQCRQGDTANSLVERADQALYSAKEKGRNRCEIAS